MNLQNSINIKDLRRFMPGCDDRFFIPYTTSYQMQHKEHQRQHGRDILEESSEEDVLMEQQYSEHDLLIHKELKKEAADHPQNGRYFMRKRHQKQLRKADERSKKVKKQVHWWWKKFLISKLEIWVMNKMKKIRNLFEEENEESVIAKFINWSLKKES